MGPMLLEGGLGGVGGFFFAGGGIFFPPPGRPPKPFLVGVLVFSLLGGGEKLSYRGFRGAPKTGPGKTLET